MSESMRKTVAALSQQFDTSIVTVSAFFVVAPRLCVCAASPTPLSLTRRYATLRKGRSRDKIVNFVQLDTLFYAASHGFDVLEPEGRTKSEFTQVGVLPSLRRFWLTQCTVKGGIGVSSSAWASQG